MTYRARNRRFRKKRGSGWTPDSSAQANKARWQADRKRRDAEEPQRSLEMMLAAIENLPSGEGDITHCLQITDFSTGKVRRWLLRRGKRINQVTMEKVGGKRTASISGTKTMDAMRAYLFGQKRHLAE